MICNSQASYGCEYFVHSTKLASQMGKPEPYIYITTNFGISLGNPAQYRYDMNAQHKNPHFSVKFVVYMSLNNRERENYV